MITIASVSSCLSTIGSNTIDAHITKNQTTNPDELTTSDEEIDLHFKLKYDPQKNLLIESKKYHGDNKTFEFRDNTTNVYSYLKGTNKTSTDTVETTNNKQKIKDDPSFKESVI